MNEKWAGKAPIRALYVYAHEDEALRVQLEKHLSTLRRQGFIAEWYDRKIVPGTDWAVDINLHLQSASIILLLVSSDFLASDYIFGAEMEKALRRHYEGTARVIPILLRPVDWEGAPFAHLQALPSDGKPITVWDNRDTAFANVAKGIRRVCEDIKAQEETRVQGVTQPELVKAYDAPTVMSPAPQTYELYNVFKKSGVPDVTFVEREDFELLKLALAQPGRGVVIEGPSGVGKTTAVEKAVENLQSDKRPANYIIPVQKLSARNPEHRSKLQTLYRWHRDTVIIDDFHRLEPSLRQELVDYLKYLADIENVYKKLVIVGIPQTGQTLANTSFDIATRIDVFKLGKVKDELILHMIEKGEKALSIRFDRKGEIVIAANGSLNIAQFICFNICYREHIGETHKNLQIIRSDIEAAISSVMQDLSRKFNESVKRFAAIGGPGKAIGLHLLEELAHTEDGYLSLPALKSRKPNLAKNIERFIQEHWMDRLYNEYPISEHHLFFDQIDHALVVDDPQLTFYLNHVDFRTLARAVGESPALVQRKVFISYSHHDVEWLQRLRIHLVAIENDSIIDLWDDTKIAAGAQWKQEITEAINTASIAILLISADFLASDFIRENELPMLLSAAETGGLTIIPIILSPSVFMHTQLSMFQAANSPSKPLIGMSLAESEAVLSKVAVFIAKKLATEEAR